MSEEINQVEHVPYNGVGLSLKFIQADQCSLVIRQLVGEKQACGTQSPEEASYLLSRVFKLNSVLLRIPRVLPCKASIKPINGTKMRLAQ